jgi:hypothetical protein
MIKFKDTLNPYQEVSTELKFIYHKEAEQELTALELAQLSLDAEKQLLL